MKKKIKRVPSTTNNVTKAIVNFLRDNGHSAGRINTQGQYDPRLSVWRKSGSRVGYSDISACIKDSNGIGRFVVIEIKTDKDRLSGEQISFIKEVRNAGGVALEIKTYNDFLIWYRNYITEI